MNRRLLIFGALIGVWKAKAAQTLVRGVQMFVPALTTNAIRLLRPGGTEVIADLGTSLKTEQLQNPARLELNVDWTKAPPVPSGGLTIVPRQLTLTGTNQYVYDPLTPLPAKHLLFVNGLFNLLGDDYTFSGGTITALHPAMLDPTAKVVIAL